MADNVVKVGVVGVGSLGQHHARIYGEIEGADLVGVYDASLERAEEIAGRHDVRAFASLAELADAVDAVSVVVPTDLHLQVFKQLAEHDLDMLMEKPIATSMGEAAEMVAIAEEKGLILQVGHVERFNPVMEYLEEQLSHPRFIEAERLASYPPPRTGALPRGTEVSVVLDLMIHDLEIILHLVRSPWVAVHAVGVPVLSATEDIANVRIQFENGCVANVTASRISQEQLRKIRVFQEDTYVSLDYMNQAGKLCRKTATGIHAEDVPIRRGDALTGELSAFVDCVQRKSDPVVSGRHASDALRLAVEICRRTRECPS